MLVLGIPNPITQNLPRHADRASGLLTASKHVRDVVNYWMTEGPRNSHTTDQKVWGSNPYGRASYESYLLLEPFFAKIKIRTRAIATTINSIELSFWSIYA